MVSGFLQLTNNLAMTPQQVEILQRHLSMVFAYEIDPTFGDKQSELNKIHNPEYENKSVCGHDHSKRQRNWPSGSIPLMAGSTPGLEPAISSTYIRRTLSETNPATNPLQEVRGKDLIKKSFQQQIDDEIMC